MTRRRGFRGRRLAAVACLAGLLVSACGETGGAPGGAAQATEPGVTDGSTPEAAGDPAEPSDVDSEGASDLASLAEDLAGEQTGSSVAPRRGHVLGADISWPQCPKGMGIPERRTLGMPMPVDEAEYVVIGLTNGPGFSPNPCLADQVQWAADRELLVSAYSVLSYPDRDQLREHRGTGPYDGSTRRGALRNVGYQQAAYNIANLRRAGLETPMVWLDVEPVSVWEWSGDRLANAAVVEGAARGYRDAGYRIGVYSTPYMWEEIVGDFGLGVPEWRAAGTAGRDEALNRCGGDWSIQGGKALLGQWLADRRDHNLTCPGVSADLGRWFHQY
jgi:hypothetical protein